MRCINRTELMKLPEGTLYCNNSLELCQKRETIQDSDGNNIDWYYVPLADCNDLDSASGIEELWLGEKETPWSVCICRDGMFDYDRYYVVYTQEDIDNMVHAISSSKPFIS